MVGEMNRILDALPFVKHTIKNTLFLEQSEGCVACAHIAENVARKSYSFSAFRHYASLDEALASRSVAGGYDAALLVCDATHAATVRGTVRIQRENPEEPIAEAELDAVLFRALWSFLNRFRPLAAVKLNVSELDLVVANIAVCGVRIHEHKVFNPIDFRGKELVIEFRGTFVPRALVSAIEKISSRVKEPVVAVERGAILSEMLGEDAICIDIRDSVADIYRSYADETAHIGRSEWGTKNISEKLGIYFGVPNAIVSDVLKRYTKNQISEKVRNAVSGLARKEIAALRESVEGVLKRAHAEKRLPIRFTVHAQGGFPSELIGDARMHEMKIWEEEKQAAPHAQKAVRAALSREEEEMVALMHYPYVDPQYAFLNQFLHRRVKWLVPHE